MYVAQSRVLKAGSTYTVVLSWPSFKGRAIVMLEVNDSAKMNDVQNPITKCPKPQQSRQYVAW